MPRLTPFKPDYTKIVFHDQFRSIKHVIDNGGVISGNPTFTDGIVLDGTGDSVDYTKLGDLRDIKTVVIDMTFGTTSEEMVDLDGGTHYLSSSSGTVSATGFSSPTIYVDGAASSTITAARHRVAVTTATAFDASALILGLRGGTYMDGTVHEVVLYKVAFTAAEVLDDNNKDTYAEIDAARATYWLPLRTQYNDGSNQVTKNIGSVGGTVQVGNGSTSTTYPIQLTPHGGNFYSATGRYIEITASGLDLDAGFTFGCLFNSAAQIGDQTLYGNTFGGTNKNGITIFGSGVVAAAHNDGTWNSKSGSISSGESPVHSAIQTWDGTTTELYIDGVKQTGTTNPTLSGTTGFRIGEVPSGALQHRGNIWTPFIFDFALTELQARAMHHKLFKNLNV